MRGIVAGDILIWGDFAGVLFSGMFCFVLWIFWGGNIFLQCIVNRDILVWGLMSGIFCSAFWVVCGVLSPRIFCFGDAIMFWGYFSGVL